MAELTLYEIQCYVHKKGFKCGGRIEGKGTKQMWRLILYRNGKEFKVGELIRFSDMPKAYEEKYRAMYKYLIENNEQET